MIHDHDELSQQCLLTNVKKGLLAVVQAGFTVARDDASDNGEQGNGGNDLHILTLIF